MHRHGGVEIRLGCAHFYGDAKRLNNLAGIRAQVSSMDHNLSGLHRRRVVLARRQIVGRGPEGAGQEVSHRQQPAAVGGGGGRRDRWRWGRDCR